MTVKVLLEGLLRMSESGTADEASVHALASWPSPPPKEAELPFLPARVLMQDFTGVPAVVDLAAMRSARKRAGKDAGKLDPLVRVDLIIDHSVQVDAFGFRDAYTRNIEKEVERNRQPYSVLRWAQQAFHNFSLVPPGMGICHQVNLEYIAKVVQVRDIKGRKVAIPDTLMGTDSHTTMVNGLGVLGWGVGGIEAEAAMLGQPAYLAPPIVVGVRFSGALPAGSTATDLVLTKVEPSLAGPKGPQDRVALPHVWQSFPSAFGNGPRPDPDAVSKLAEEGGPVNGRAAVAVEAKPAARLENGCVVIAAITSCTNTSNPSVMVAAGAVR